MKVSNPKGTIPVIPPHTELREAGPFDTTLAFNYFTDTDTGL
jgi:hypothetical protein